MPRFHGEEWDKVRERESRASLKDIPGCRWEMYPQRMATPILSLQSRTRSVLWRSCLVQKRTLGGSDDLELERRSTAGGRWS
jgi:hypothetical protein